MKNSTKNKSDGILLLARRYTPLQKYAGYLYTMHLSISQAVNMDKRQLIEVLKRNPKNVRFRKLCKIAEAFDFKFRGGKKICISTQ